MKKILLALLIVDIQPYTGVWQGLTTPFDFTKEAASVEFLKTISGAIQ